LFSNTSDSPIISTGSGFSMWSKSIDLRKD
jgi:hypothetical protein